MIKTWFKCFINCALSVPIVTMYFAYILCKNSEHFMNAHRCLKFFYSAGHLISKQQFLDFHLVNLIKTFKKSAEIIHGNSSYNK